MALKVTGTVNGQELAFQARSPDAYSADAGRSDDGAYRSAIVARDEYGNVSVARDTVYTGDQWIEPIWYRTQNDVERARYLNKKAAEGLAALTPEEQEEWLSGMLGALNSQDMNRIETDTGFLSGLLYSLGYGLKNLQHKTDWKVDELTFSRDLERIRGNVQRLIDAFHKQKQQLPSSLQHPDWQQINAVERILYEMREMIRRMEESFAYCGTINSGQGVVL